MPGPGRVKERKILRKIDNYFAGRNTRLVTTAERKIYQPMLARRLGLFDATMIVMGGIIGSGIFINPYVVARQVHTPALILGAWWPGGVVALLGAFVYAELAARRPEVGGQYAYLRDAYHPSSRSCTAGRCCSSMQTGGMAAVAVTFARYSLEITGSHAGMGRRRGGARCPHAHQLSRRAQPGAACRTR